MKQSWGSPWFFSGCFSEFLCDPGFLLFTTLIGLLEKPSADGTFVLKQEIQILPLTSEKKNHLNVLLRNLRI